MSRTKKSRGANPKAVVRKVRVAGKTRGKAKPAKLVKAKAAAQTGAKSAAANRAQGLRFFQIAGRPTKDEFIAVYGSNGHRLTWEQRTELGVSAKQFRAALATKRAVR